MRLNNRKEKQLMKQGKRMKKIRIETLLISLLLLMSNTLAEEDPLVYTYLGMDYGAATADDVTAVMLA
jgi:hypothetical protein